MKYYYSESLSIENFDGFHLLQDHRGTNYKSPWDDFGYIITFKLYYVTEKKKRKLGSLKLLIKDIEDSSLFFKEHGKPLEPKFFEITDILNIDNIVSIGEDVDLYKKINSLFSEGEAEDILIKICDAGYYHEQYEEFSSWKGFSGSFMRGSAASAILKKGFQIALGRYIPEKTFDITLNELGDTFDDLCLKFDTNREIGKSNINLLIGKNGVGKSHALKKLSEIITGVIDTKTKHPYFHKLIMIAFSPFESFYTKSEIFKKLSTRYSVNEETNNRKSESRKRLHVNEYSYIGFKNENGEHDLNHPIKLSIDSLIKVIDYDDENSWWEEQSRFKILKDTLSLCIDFDSVFISNNDNQEFEVTSTLDTKSLKNKLNYSNGIIFKKDGNVLPLSSGQQIYSYMIPAIIAELEEESLLVLDEPELYLHPELEVGLMNMLQHILKETKSYSIIATHSAILAREVESKAITILRKHNGKTEANISSVETYGESLDIIISEVFDDDYMIKPFQREIDRYLKKEDSSISTIKEHIGDDALAYALSKLDNVEDIEIEDM
ncbi:MULTISPECIES: AAA family ATPase [Pseudoalteromonas]|uniref:ATP-binding protein n=1 Tax=Pseudoalteromonas neustonica TaxID=1840331 RepID=A0ABY3FH73_9GAMM|nr:AAA family ATPase [Pseudoalteromonas neustonica]TVU85029.1 ATP-binding protein [Pseudoalteromonas neustonica]